MRRPIVKLCFALFLSLIVGVVFQITYTNAVSAQSITSLSSDISRLRTRVNQLESQVRNLSRSIPRINQPSQVNPPRSIDRGNTVDSSDPMFQRLATLVIELKEQVKDLDKRVKKIENIIN